MNFKTYEEVRNLVSLAGDLLETKRILNECKSFEIFPTFQISRDVSHARSVLINKLLKKLIETMSKDYEHKVTFESALEGKPIFVKLLIACIDDKIIEINKKLKDLGAPIIEE